jgi:hypothetical protein
VTLKEKNAAGNLGEILAILLFSNVSGVPGIEQSPTYHGFRCFAAENYAVIEPPLGVKAENR